MFVHTVRLAYSLLDFIQLQNSLKDKHLLFYHLSAKIVFLVSEKLSLLLLKYFQGMLVDVVSGDTIDCRLLVLSQFLSQIKAFVSSLGLRKVLKRSSRK